MSFSPGVNLLKGRNSNISNVWREKILQKSRKFQILAVVDLAQPCWNPDVTDQNIRHSILFFPMRCFIDGFYYHIRKNKSRTIQWIKSRNCNVMEDKTKIFSKLWVSADEDKMRIKTFVAL